ncbi:AAA family ATPase [Aliiruegeria lutimaris]|uniref:AAA domain-containing protein n=1 Tax=Aliiruegeria lutimaris TaxID=571298 RepID=A0A1G9ESL8_9RHOB|nr:AAA family ATPase [Aliiruegeria lutimaris]SDK78995.1 AAA domain-containing protein [Aliiruegeria lutimaris]
MAEESHDDDITLEDLINLADAGDFGIDEELAFRSFDPKKKPARGINRLIGDIVARKRVTVFAGAGGVSKSTLMALIAMQAARGEQVFGLEVKERLKVTALNFEDDQDTLDRAGAAVAQRNEIEEIPKPGTVTLHGKDQLRRLFKLDRTESLTYFDELAESETAINWTVRNGITDLIRTTNADVLIIDPLAALMGGVNMSNSTMNRLVRDLADIAIEFDIAVILVSHVRKSQGGGGDRPRTADDIKFGGELVDTSRCAIMVDDVPTEYVKRWRNAAPESGPFDNLKMAAVVKTNIGRSRVFYYRVELMQVECENDDIETVPVAVPFNPPSMAETSTAELFLKVYKRLTNEFVKKSVQSTAGVNIRDVLKPHLKDERKWKSTLDDMLADGLVKAVYEENPESTNRRKVERIVPASRIEEMQDMLNKRKTPTENEEE